MLEPAPSQQAACLPDFDEPVAFVAPRAAPPAPYEPVAEPQVVQSPEAVQKSSADHTPAPIVSRVSGRVIRKPLRYQT